MQRIFLLFFIPVLWGIIGCAPTVRMQSRINPDMKVSIKKLYVVLSATEKAAPMVTAMELRFTGQLRENGIEAKVYIVDPLSLDPNEYRMDEWKYNPDAVLFVRYSEGTTVEGALTGAVFNATLYDKKMATILWRANVSADFGRPMSWSSSGEAFVQGILEKMWQDGLMGSKLN